MQALRKRVAAWFRTHWSSTVVATVGSLVFFGASLFEDEIRAAFPFYWGPYDGWSIPAVLFWLGVGIVTFLLGLKNFADDNARKELIDATRDVSVLVQTLPPRSWREEFAATMDEAGDSLAALLPRRPSEGLTRDQLGEVIARLLGSLAVLAYRYDSQPLVDARPALYAANVMLFVPRASSAPYFSGELRAALRFVPEGSDLGALRGLLKLEPSLSFSSWLNGRDADVPPIALPVPAKEKGDDGRWRVLPGAPLAFVGNGIDGYADVATMSSWLDSAADFPPSVRDDVAAYFKGPGAASRSLLSRRLMSDDGQPTGVLNLHSNRPNLLGVPDGVGAEYASVSRREDFMALTTPLMREVECAVALYGSWPV